ncbi:transcription factor IIIB 90 kDa subunit-like [Saccostrea cucullata]|uniref:transcription factor IIIB 90 kDa subunit-like n=1 Tax=Saccostrea cuccullata TaxID=36930 RepID=UPI002ED1EFA3
MSSTGVCTHCGCTEIDKDPARGDAVCTNCGSVLEDQIIVSEIQFEEHATGASSVIGQFVSTDGSKSHSLGISFPHGMKRESRTVTFDNGRKRIQQLGVQLKLNQHCIDTAFNFFKMAVNRRMTQGRKTTHVIAACLYIVCRTEGTPHMLLDISDQLQINVYSLGKTYLQLSRALCINIPAIDPCLYIPRFAHKLEFGEKTHEVSMTALRLVSRMKRDWMHTGRRPSGLCGAALLVAARMHDFSRSVKDLIKIVKVCDTTIRKRLTEFKNTPSSQLTIEEFQTIDLEEEQDPPSYTEGKAKALKAKQLQIEQAMFPQIESEMSDLQKEIEEGLVPAKPRGIWAAYANASSSADLSGENSRASSPDMADSEIKNVSDFLENETLKPCLDEEDLVIKEKPPNQEAIMMEKKPLQENIGMIDVVKKCVDKEEVEVDTEKTVDGELDLTGIDDEELEKQFVLTEEEIKLKTTLWMAENKDYLIALKEKEERLAKEKEEEAKNPEKKKPKRTRKKRVPIQAATAEEAIYKLIHEKKISNKINYDVLNDLKCQSGPSHAPLTTLTTPKVEDTTTDNPEKKTMPSTVKKETEEPEKKRMKVEKDEDSDAGVREGETAAVVVEHGPVQYIQNLTEEEANLEEEEEEEFYDEDEPVSAAKLLGHDQVQDYEDLYDDD